MYNDNNSSNKSGSTAGIGFSGLLAVAFIVLKLCKVIDWSWVWVLSPIWIPFAIIVVILVVIVAVSFIQDKKPKKR